MQGQPLAGVEADPHRPVLPAQRVTVQGEAGPLGLGDLDGPERGPVRAADGLVVVVAGLGRHRELELVGDLEDLLLDQVHVGGQPVDGVRPGQVVLALLDERQHPDHPAPVVLGRPERARGDRAGPDLAEVVVAPPGHGGAPVRVGLGDLVHPGEVAVQDGHLAVDGRVQGACADHFLVGQRHHHVGRLAAAGVDQVRAQPPVRGLTRQHLVLGGLLEAVVGEPDGCPVSCWQAARPPPRCPGRPGTPPRWPGRAGAGYSSATIDPTRSPRPGSRLTSQTEYRMDTATMPKPTYGNQ